MFNNFLSQINFIKESIKMDNNLISFTGSFFTLGNGWRNTKYIFNQDQVNI